MLAQLIQDNMFLVFFVYGLAFFLMGWSIVIRTPGKLDQLSRGFGMIAVFGMLHGLVEWIDMYYRIKAPVLQPSGQLFLDSLRILLLGISFYYLMRAGLQFAAPRSMHVARWALTAWAVVLGLAAVQGALARDTIAQWQQTLLHLEILTRYGLALPASLLVCFGLWKFSGFLKSHYDVRIINCSRGALACFGFYALLGGIITPTDSIGLAWLFNYNAFQSVFHLPVQAFRALTALGLLYFIIRILDIFQRDQINRDAKTGLYTTPIIYQFIAGHRHRERPLSVLFIDIDHFKRVNDRLGHLVGDDVLVKLAGVLMQDVRSNDLVGRFGGEEFVIVLHDEASAGAVQVAERLRERIAQMQFPNSGDGFDLQITVSIGVAEWQAGISIEQLLAKADEAMYLAKAQGRNRVVSADAPRRERQPEIVHLNWNEQWNSGQAEIDLQHRQMLEQGNVLISLSLADGSREALTAQLDVIIQHVAMHFAYEERVLDQLHYPDVEGHERIHKALVSEALAFRENGLSGQLQPHDYFTFIVSKVIIGHMLKEDVKYYPYTLHPATEANRPDAGPAVRLAPDAGATV